MAIPTDGLVFYAPLKTDTTTTTGHVLTNNGVTFDAVSGLDTAVFEGVSYLSFEQSNFPKNNESFTFSSWIYLNGYQAGERFIFGWGGSGNGTYFIPCIVDISLQCSNHGGNWFENAYNFYTDRWYHLLISGNGSAFKVFVNGQLVNSYNTNYSIGQSNFAIIGNYLPNPSFSFNGCINSIRVYNRALTDDEVKILSSEFKQDTSDSNTSGTTGFILNGLFLSSSKPKSGQKGLLLDNKYFLPLVEGGGAGEYYKCASVDTETNTWTGYKAVLEDGVYTFESTVTSGLTYTSVTPVVGNIYSADALVQIAYMAGNIPESGLVFYAPLAEYKATAETGQALSHGGNYQYSNYMGIPSLVTEKGYINVSDVEALRSCGSTFTLCFWSNTNSDQDITSFGVQSAFACYWASCTINGDYGLVENREPDKWYFSAYVQNESVGQGYINGNKLPTAYNQNISLSGTTKLVIGARENNSFEWIGALSSFRIYNRALSEDEISALANEFNVAGGQ